MKKKPEKTKASLTGSTLSIFAAPSQNVPEERADKQTGSKRPIEKPGTFWELLHDAELRAMTEPWPPKEGAGKLKVEVTATEGREFGGTVAYRIAKTEKNSAAWQPLSKMSTDKSGSVFFEAPILLGKGAVYIQFRVRGAGEEAYQKEFIDLADWSVEVK